MEVNMDFEIFDKPGIKWSIEQIDNIQEEFSNLFKLSFLGHCAQMQRSNQNLLFALTRNVYEVRSIN